MIQLSEEEHRMSATNLHSPGPVERRVLLFGVLGALVVSGIGCADRLTWLLESVWILLAATRSPARVAAALSSRSGRHAIEHDFVAAGRFRCVHGAVGAPQ